MNRRLASFIGALLLLSCFQSLRLSGVAQAQARETFSIGVAGECGANGEPDPRNFTDHALLERFIYRPILSPRDGTLLRRAAVVSVRTEPPTAGASSVLTVNSSMTFADGSPFSAADLEFSINRCRRGAASVIDVGGGDVKVVVKGETDDLRRCPFVSQRAAELFGARFEHNGAVLASGPYEPYTLSATEIVVARMAVEVRGAKRVTILRCQPLFELISLVRTGVLEAAYLPLGTVAAAKVSSTDETVFTKPCQSDAGYGYEVFSRNRTISCIEGLDPLAIIPG